MQNVACTSNYTNQKRETADSRGHSCFPRLHSSISRRETTRAYDTDKLKRGTFCRVVDWKRSRYEAAIQPQPEVLQRRTHLRGLLF